MLSSPPNRGDLIWLNFSPQAGRDQAVRRPGLVVTSKKHNQRTGLAIVCPITSKVKGFPFEVLLPADCGIDGVVLSNQVRTIDWTVRAEICVGQVPSDVVSQVAQLIQGLLD